jgi:hypothetical protein
MLATLLLAASAAPAAPVPADAHPAPAGPAPWVVHLKDDGTPLQLLVQAPRKVKQTHTVVENVNGQQQVKQVVRDVTIMQATQVALTGLAATVTTADGAPSGVPELLRRAKDGVTVLVSADGKPVERAWLRSVSPTTLVVAAEALAATLPPMPLQNRAGAATPAPRLTLLAAGTDGTVRVSTRPTVGGRHVSGRAVFVNGGAMMIDDGFAVPPTAGTPQSRPLGEVGFDAYDLSGRLVAKDEAVRRLRAGGLVLVSADARFPDPHFVQPFRGDLLVLVSGEGLSAPAAPAAPEAPGVAKPAVIQAVPAQAVPLAAPAPIVRPALRVAPLARPVPAPAKDK